MQILRDLADAIRAEARCNDVVQLELIGENIQNHVSITINDEDDDAILPAFEGLLELLVQSNADIALDARLELIIEVVCNPRGGVKRRLEKTLDCELIRKKKRHLYVINNKDDRLCFAISLAHLIDPEPTDNQTLERGREWQHLAGLNDQTPVTFSDVCKFETILNHKIVVFYRSPNHLPLSQFETDFSDRSDPLFLLLFQNHYYGIKNLEGFLGVSFVCHYCYRGYEQPYAHICKGYCSVCSDPICTQQELTPVVCVDCNRTYRTPTCFTRHKEPKERPLSEMCFSTCDSIKRCLQCKKTYYVAQSKDRGKKAMITPVHCLNVRSAMRACLSTLTSTITFATFNLSDQLKSILRN
ncbi:hypothetical protein LDENG_00228980 [Lucifuga dentata]|nr:hypothetical protein LDENG_00228980 [Lucifuga dentata]